MGKVNVSSVTEFYLMGFSNDKNQTMALFGVFLLIYLLTLLGNLLIIFVAVYDQKLNSPMYFFLGNLTFVDISLSSVTAPLMLANLLREKKTISFKGCMSQLLFLFCTAGMESFVLAVMAYDRLVAISKPLRYLYVMNRKTCMVLIVSCWVCASLHSLLHTCMIFSMDFCGPNRIHEHFCDVPPLLALSCSDTSQFDLMLFTEGSVLATSPLIFIVVSYCKILKIILRMHSSSGGHQAFSTCSSHLTSVGLFYGSAFFTYFHPSSSISVEDNRSVTIVYSILTPLLNPFIYSLRNKQIKESLKIFPKRSIHP